MSNRRAVIMAGGKGSRLRPFTFVIPKPLIPVGDMPIIEILLRQLAHHGFGRISVAVGHHSELIRSFCGDGTRWDVEVDYLIEDQPLGTAGSLGLLDESELDRILVVNGDTLTDMDLQAVHDCHDAADAMTVCVTERTVELPFGSIEHDSRARLTGYLEKPTLTYDAAMGITVIAVHAIREFLPRPEPIDMPQLIHRLQGAEKTVRVHRSHDRWLDVGHIDELEAAVDVVEGERERFIPPR